MLAQDCHEQLVIGGEFRNGKLAVSMKRGSAELVLLLHDSHEETDPRNMRNMRQKKLPQLSSSRLIPAYSSFAFQTGRTLAGCKEWWFWPGVKDEIRLIPVHKIAAHLGRKALRNNPCMYLSNWMRLHKLSRWNWEAKCLESFSKR